jgi:voltage-gated potassium channel
LTRTRSTPLAGRPGGAGRPLARRVFGTVPGVRWLVGGILLVTLGCSLLVRVVAASDFPTMGTALWWAAQTVTTVGYGDVVPQSTGGKFIAATLMITAIASVSLLTAAVSAAWVNRLQTRRQAEMGDPVLEALARIERRLDDVERRIDAGARS